ncbi:MAG: NAD-dependent epimerase/dehydratase family protein [Roseibacillus sp.]|jgi:nucleoside-diphosphate-sugar epimerase|nr:NAD-dependent epimerase/dehydratase family protein [Roseibacillus sp.]MDP6209307.1 NAD-dependent epimerase/dehydratase family protein [Roseibacillus sp.]MDP7308732.1 NAD-dependent epimerase/dehydratase family protein [Roseibacillus sp.]MDP7496398.1 NAD-dependent epimerase/dehydratase family protein [Roseibacillus sp.]HJM62589.1 NAD-dependent epimerase/dehydratase family protein [Roseibacillus sp.]|tara:strand:+ start:1169 stop:2170 length:1002 start_codon:yes stop_codon:yes gene_type:complete
MTQQQKRILIAGGGGFIGGHLAGSLLAKGHQVVVADIKSLDQWYQVHGEAENHVLNLEEKQACYEVMGGCDEVYNLACNMGGMGFIEFNRALCMISVLINTHLLMGARDLGVKGFFYASSACVYPDYRQDDADVMALKESDAYPAQPEDGYGWEKLFSERMCRNFHEDFGLNVRVFRFHNVYGPFGTWVGGREKAPAALCRKVIEAADTGNHEIEIWGDGEQTRSFMYIDDCVGGMARLMGSGHSEPLNLGRAELVSINGLLEIIEGIAGITLNRNYDLSKPQGVRGRNSDNTLIRETLGWEPEVNLATGLEKTYHWIKEQYERRKRGEVVVD